MSTHHLPLMTFTAVLLASPLVRAQETPTPTETPAPAAAPAPAPVPADLANRIDEIDQRSRIVERKLELADEAAAARKLETPVVTADDKGFGLSSADHGFELKLHGLLQLDARRHMDTSDPSLADKDTFVLRRIRPIFDGTFLGLADFRITPDFGNNTVAVYDAYLDLHPQPWLRLRAGKFKPPVGLERLQADQNVVFVERALDSNLSAQRDVGLQLWGDIANAVVHYELGIYNGAADGTITDIDNDHAKTYGGRLFLRPFQVEGLRGLGDLGLGIAFTTGNEKGSSALTSGAASNTWLPSFKSPAQDTIYSYVASTTDLTQTVFALKRHTRVNPQLYYYVGGFGLLAEWVKETQDVGKGATTASVDNKSGHVTASFLIGGDSSYDGPKVKHPVNWATKDFGALEIGVRLHYLDLDDASFKGLADPSKSVTKAVGEGLALNWWLNRNVKIAGNWDRTKFTGGAGTSKAVANRATENVAVARFQISF